MLLYTSAVKSKGTEVLVGAAVNVGSVEVRSDLVNLFTRAQEAALRRWRTGADEIQTSHVVLAVEGVVGWHLNRHTIRMLLEIVKLYNSSSTKWYDNYRTRFSLSTWPCPSFWQHSGMLPLNPLVCEEAEIFKKWNEYQMNGKVWILNSNLYMWGRDRGIVPTAWPWWWTGWWWCCGGGGLERWRCGLSAELRLGRTGGRLRLRRRIRPAGSAGTGGKKRPTLGSRRCCTSRRPSGTGR